MRTAQEIAAYWARLEPLPPPQICDEVRFCRRDKTHKADVKIITLNIVSPELRFLLLEEEVVGGEEGRRRDEREGEKMQWFLSAGRLSILKNKEENKKVEDKQKNGVAV